MKAIAYLIEAMGMLVHDLQEIKKDCGMPYSEECYTNLVNIVLEMCEKKPDLIGLANDALNQYIFAHGRDKAGTSDCVNFIERYLKLAVPSDKGFEIVLSFSQGVCCVTECSERVSDEDSDPDTPRDIESIAFKVAENTLKELSSHPRAEDFGFVLGYVSKAVYDATELYPSVFEASRDHNLMWWQITKFELCKPERV